MDYNNPSRLLVVEGFDDKHVIKHLLAKSDSNLDFEIKDVGGYPRLLQSINPEVKAPGRERLGFLLDADDDLNGHWIKVREELIRAGVAPPDRLSRDGCIFGDGLIVGVWVMPNNISSGELENFVIEMLPVDDSVWPLAVKYIDSVPENERKFRIEKSDKAKLHAWLSTRKRPGKMGAAIRADDLIVANQLSKNFLRWLEDLYS